MNRLKAASKTSLYGACRVCFQMIHTSFHFECFHCCFAVLRNLSIAIKCTCEEQGTNRRSLHRKVMSFLLPSVNSQCQSVGTTPWQFMHAYIFLVFHVDWTNEEAMLRMADHSAFFFLGNSPFSIWNANINSISVNITVHCFVIWNWTNFQESPWWLDVPQKHICRPWKISYARDVSNSRFFRFVRSNNLWWNRIEKEEFGSMSRGQLVKLLE